MALAQDPKTGEYKYWDGSDWVPSKIAEKPDTKERFAWDGSDWKSIGKTPSGFKAAVSSGIDALQQQLYSAGEGAAGALGLEGLARSAGEAAARNKAEAEAALPEQMQFGEAESLGDYWQAAKEALGTSLPQMAPSVVAGALTGAAAGSAVPVLGTGIGALLGGTLAGIPQFFGANRERQKEESGVVQSEGAALLASIPQAAMDSLLGKFIPGANRAVAGGLLTRAVKSGAEGVITEAPTEFGQTVIERFQAGLPLDNEEAMAEYKEAAIAGGVLGGGIGGISGAAQKRAMTDQEMRALAGQEQSDLLQQNIEAARLAASTPAPAIAPPAAAAAAPAVTTPPAATPVTDATAPEATAIAEPAAPAESIVDQQAAETAAQIQEAAAPAPAKELPKGEPVVATFLNDDGSPADKPQEMQLVGNEPDGRPILITPDGLTIRPRPDRIKIEPLKVTTPSPAQQTAQAEPAAAEPTMEEILASIRKLIEEGDAAEAAALAAKNAPAPDQATDLSEAVKTLIENADLKAAPTPAPAENVPSMVQPEPEVTKEIVLKPLNDQQIAKLDQSIAALGNDEVVRVPSLRTSLSANVRDITPVLDQMVEAGTLYRDPDKLYRKKPAAAPEAAPAAPEAVAAPAEPAVQPAAQGRSNIVQAAFDLARSLARKTREGEAVDPLDFADEYSLDPELARDILSTNPLFKEEDGIFYRTELPATDAVAAPVAPTPTPAPTPTKAPAAPKATAPKAKAPKTEVAAEPTESAAARIRDKIASLPLGKPVVVPAVANELGVTIESVRGVQAELAKEGIIARSHNRVPYKRTKKAYEPKAPKVKAPKVEKVAEVPKVPTQEQAVPETAKPVEAVAEKPTKPKAAPKTKEAAPAKVEVKEEPKVSEAIAPVEKPKAVKAAPPAKPKAEAKPVPKPKAEVAPKPSEPAAEKTETETVTEKVDVADLLAALKKEAAAAPQLTDNEKLAMAGINKLSLKPDSVVSALTLMTKIREINPNSGLTAAKIKNEIFPELAKKGILVPGEKGTGNFLIPPKQKAAPKPRGPRTQESRRAGAERAAAKKNLDKVKAAAPVEEEADVEGDQDVRDILKKEKDPDKRLLRLLDASAIDLEPDEFAKELNRIIKDKVAQAPKDEPFDATYLGEARDAIEDLEGEDAISDAQKILADAIDQTENLLEPEARDAIKEAWSGGEEASGAPTELTTDQKIKKMFDVLSLLGNKVTLGNIGQFVNTLDSSGYIDAKSNYWQKIMGEVYGIYSNEGRISAISYLENKVDQYRAEIRNKPAEKTMTPKQEAQKKIDDLHDNNQINTNSLLGLVDDFVKKGLFGEDIAKVVRSSIKGNAYQGSIVLERALNAKSVEELSARGATAPETEAEAEAKPKRTKRRKGKKKAAKEAKAAPELTPEQIAEREARRAEAQRFLDERLAKMEASGPFGQKAAAEVRRVLADGDISNVQAHHAFVMAEIATKLLKGTAANPDIRFLKSVDYDGRRLRRGNPDALAGLIEFSLNDAEGKSVLGYSRETAAHEPFHVLQDLMEQYDPATSKILFGQRTGVDPDTGHGIYKGGAFRDGMTLADISPSIQRTLKNLSPEPGGGSYWSRFSEQYNAQGPAGEKLRSEFAKQREAMAYVFGMLADAKERGFNTNSLDPAFKRFVNFLAAFREKMGSFLRGEGYRSTDQVLEDYISGERQKGYGEEVDRTGSQEFSSKDGEFSVRGGRLSEKAEMAINRGQLQNASKNLTIMQRLKAAANRMFDPLADLTGRDQYLIQRYRALGNVSRLEKEAKSFYDTIHKATDTQKKAIFSYLTTRGAIVPNLPANLQKAAVDVKQQINQIGENMVARGMLSQESLDEYKDSYLPRLYMKYLLEGKNVSVGLRVGSQEYLKQRKNLTVEERVALGEVEEPSFLAFSAMYRPQRDMAIMDFLSGIAQTGNDWVLPDTLIDWKGRKVTAFWLADEARAMRERMKYEPDPKKSKAMGKEAERMQKLADPVMNDRIPENYKQLPKTNKYGALKGMIVRKEIYDDLVGAAQFNADPSMADELFGDRNSSLSRGTQFWKMTKTILNPPTQVRNFISNAVMLNLSGVSPPMVIPRMLQAMKQMRTNGPAWQIAKQYGVEATGFNEQEMREVNQALQEYLSKNSSGMMNVKGLVNVFSKFSNRAGDLYQWSEQVFKTAKIIDELEKGKVSSMPAGSKARRDAEGAAALQAHKWFFDYSLVPPSIRSIRTMPFGAPFITYYYKALPVLAEVAMNPRTAFRFAPYVALTAILPAAVASSYDVEDEDIDKLRMSMSEQLREKPNMLIIPWKDEAGNWQFLDAGYFFPWTMFLTTASSLAKGDVAGALSSVGALSSPALSAATAIKTNIDPFSGREIINKADPPHEQMMSLVHYVNNLISPPFLTQYGFAGKIYDNMTNSGMNRYGEPNQDAVQITGRFFGFNFYPVVPEMQRARNLMKMKGDINEVRMRLSYVAKDLSLTPEQRQRAVEDYTAEIQKRTEELVQYAKDSDIPGALKKKQE